MFKNGRLIILETQNIDDFFVRLLLYKLSIFQVSCHFFPRYLTIFFKFQDWSRTGKHVVIFQVFFPDATLLNTRHIEYTSPTLSLFTLSLLFHFHFPPVRIRK